MDRTVILRGPSQRDHAKNLIDRMPADYRVVFHEPKRSDAQNRRLWAALKDVSEQVLWDGERLTDVEWKDFLTAILRKARMVRHPEGGRIVVGASTSRMSVAQFNDLLALIDAFGTEQGVVWSEPHPDEADAA